MNIKTKAVKKSVALAASVMCAFLAVSFAHAGDSAPESFVDHPIEDSHSAIAAKYSTYTDVTVADR